MNTLAKQISISTIILSFFLSIPAIAQITINDADYPLYIGETISYSSLSDTLGNGLAVDVGAAGGSQSWTFTRALYPNGEIIPTMGLNPSQTPYASIFPNANIAILVELSDSAFSYSYERRQSDGLYYHGSASAFGSFRDTTIVDPPELAIPFPLTMGTTFNKVDVDTLNIGGGVIIVDSTYENSIIDAWGNITIEEGTFQCLRARSNDRYVATTFFNGVPISRFESNLIEYTWLAKDKGIVASVTSMDDESNPNFTLASSISFKVNLVAIDDRESALAQGYALEQNYPNPFNPSTTISFELPVTENALLTVYDITGRAVATLVNRRMNPGRHAFTFEAANLASGVYFYQLQTSSITLTRRMLLLK